MPSYTIAHVDNDSPVAHRINLPLRSMLEWLRLLVEPLQRSVGDPAAPKTAIGPMVRKAVRASAVLHPKGIEEGAECLPAARASERVRAGSSEADGVRQLTNDMAIARKESWSRAQRHHLRIRRRRDSDSQTTRDTVCTPV